MEAHHQRGRSPSVGQQAIKRQTPSPSPHSSYHTPMVSAGLGLDQSLVGASNSFISNFDSNLNSAGQHPFNLSNSDFNQQPQYSQSQSPFLQPQGSPQNPSNPSFGQQGDGLFSPGLLDGNNPLPNAQDSYNQQFFQNGGANEDPLDPNYLVDPQLLGGGQSVDQSIDPSALLNPASSAPNHDSIPAHLLQPDMRHSSISPQASPSLVQGGFSPNHSRHASLDPSSAAFPPGTGDWSGMRFGSHRRTPSDQYSEVSSQPSPYLGNTEPYDPIEHPSPLMGAQVDPQMAQGAAMFEQITLSENQVHQGHGYPGVSPHHSPHISPNLAAQQQSLPAFTSVDNFGLNQSIGGPYDDVFQNQNQETFPSAPENGMSMNNGQGSMPTPGILISFEPPSRQGSFEPPKPDVKQEDTLQPPSRSPSRNRERAKSDPHAGRSRGSTPALEDRLSPNHARSSRSPSPSGVGKNRRSSTSSVPHDREYMLGLANPDRPSSGASGESVGSGSKRTQKHPATFQCSLCPKRFTRAYNLRSHLRTHTDERPFVCTVCGKAFARQHDRKRHEGLHSGEKKFVCRGQLKSSSQWGCGRRFARADALGRHFRSEAGRVCIRPLLEEEAAEKSWDAAAASQSQSPGMHAGMMGMESGQMGPGIGMSTSPQPGFEGYSGSADPAAQMPYRLPAALLAQYPTLSSVWDSLPTTTVDDLDDRGGDISGRSSYDAGSGYEDEGEGEFGDQRMGASGWVSDSGYY
ncbi:hypothetical protein P152DRAFT_465353 [Eremomyces bilateralis CBS 781.70]|uniref:C2H2-type domain-containing protein n=1 Tax=Eremomyces bilateralis CBS 781.70 TaxID=1392243 RepID=A0A6G1G8X5_9PEZI|nr:uncharacterized protein P152DRAFT_465353 [Eremomyces bilateralis CBS 781.70]KAF1814528.1 hypothetical protein P152DRAFT_465353 [Eremomyces bilateralis CBS 781.70]